MKGKIMMLAGLVLTVFSAVWLTGLLPLRFVVFPIETYPADGMTLTELKTAKAVTPFTYNVSTIEVVRFTYDSNQTSALLLTQTTELQELIWEGRLMKYPAEGSHNFVFEFYGRSMGDVNGDAKIDGVDLNLTGAAFGAREGDPRWNPKYDLDKSGQIDGIDNSIISRNIGQNTQTKLLLEISGSFTIVPEPPSTQPPTTEPPKTEPPAEVRQTEQVTFYLKIVLLLAGIILSVGGFVVDQHES